MIKKLSVCFFSAMLILIFATFQQYGLTWDEESHRIYGELIIRWYGSFFSDSAAIRHDFLIYYGGFFDLVAQLAAKTLPFDVFETRHLVGAFFGLWTIWMCFKIARHVAGEMAGLFAALFLALHPAFYGHMFNNPVDIPFGALFMTVVYYVLLTCEELPRPSKKKLFKLGISIGLALAIRIGGVVVLLALIGASWSAWILNQAKNSATAEKMIVLKNAGQASMRLMGVAVIAWLTMLIGWPWAQINPILNPIRGIWKALHWAQHWDWERAVYFEGHNYRSWELPKTYLLKSILISLPEFFLIVFLIGIILGVLTICKKKRGIFENAERLIKIGVLFFPVVFCLAATFLFRNRLFDGFRHFLFLIPLLAILASLSLTAFFKTRAPRFLKIALSTLLCCSVGLTIFDMIRLHPYQTIYFNRLLTGGLPKAAAHYETDYWGNSYKEGIEWVIQNYHPKIQRKIRVKNSSAIFQTGHFLSKTQALRDRFEMVVRDPDIYLSTTRWNLHRAFPGKVLYTVERDQVPLLYVIEVAKA